MKKVLFIFFIIIVSPTVFAQPGLTWVHALGDATSNGYNAFGCAVTADNTGNVYAAGYFNGTIDFDPGSGTTSKTAQGTNGDVYLSKYNAGGNLQWVKTIKGFTNLSVGGANYGYVQLGIDKNGDIILTGQYEGSVDLNPDAGVDSVTSTLGQAVFISKFNPNGNFVWGKNIDFYGRDFMSLDKDGNIYLSGSYSGQNDFNPSGVVDSLPWSGFGGGMYFAKYDNNGNLVWVKGTQGNAFAEAWSTAVSDSGYVYVCGEFTELVIDFDPGVGVQNRNRVSFGSGGDFFLAKYTGNGDFVWAKTFGHPFGFNSANLASHVRLTNTGDVILFGRMSGNVDFSGTGALDTIGYETYNSLGTPLFFAKYNGVTGDYVFAKALYGNPSNYPGGLAIDSAGTIFIASTMGGWCDADPGTGYDSLSADSQYGLLLAGYSPTGNYLWGNVVVSPTGSSWVNGIHIDENGALYTTGTFQSITDFDITASVSNQTPPNNFAAIYVAKYAGNSPSAVIHLKEENTFTAFPNPFKNQIIIRPKDATTDKANIQVFDITGRRIFEQELQNETVQLHTHSWNTGTYFIRLGEKALKVIKTE